MIYMQCINSLGVRIIYHSPALLILYIFFHPNILIQVLARIKLTADGNDREIVGALEKRESN